MMYRVEDDFERLRNEWALKAPLPTMDAMNMERQSDFHANPHNDTYANKRPRRSDNEIQSDRMYEFADNVLTRQYGSKYRAWLQERTEERPHLKHLRKMKEGRSYYED